LTFYFFTDVYIDVPDTIDITHMRSKGLQPGEELLPEGGSGDDSAEPANPVASEDIVTQLASMGFNYLHCQKAAINTSNTGVEEAMNWLLSHMDDPDINDPISKDSRAYEPSVDEASVQTLISFGFQEDIAIKALKASGGNIEKATDWIFSHPEASTSASADSSTSNVNADDTYSRWKWQIQADGVREPYGHLYPLRALRSSCPQRREVDNL